MAKLQKVFTQYLAENREKGFLKFFETTIEPAMTGPIVLLKSFFTIVHIMLEFSNDF